MHGSQAQWIIIHFRKTTHLPLPWANILPLKVRSVLILAWERGRWAFSQKRKMIRHNKPAEGGEPSLHSSSTWKELCTFQSNLFLPTYIFSPSTLNFIKSRDTVKLIGSLMHSIYSWLCAHAAPQFFVFLHMSVLAFAYYRWLRPSSFLLILKCQPVIYFPVCTKGINKDWLQSSLFVVGRIFKPGLLLTNLNIIIIIFIRISYRSFWWWLDFLPFYGRSCVLKKPCKQFFKAFHVQLCFL